VVGQNVNNMSKRKNKNKLSDKNADFIASFQVKTEKQQDLLDSILTKEITISVGVAGSGKTITTLAAALSLLNKGYKKIFLVKSVVTIPGESIGFLPGNTDDKMEPFLMSYTWNIDKLLTKGSSQELLHNKTVEILPLAYIRGLSIDNSIVIIDEAQNLDFHTFKTIITRIGSNSKYIFLGDIEQVDRKKDSSLAKV
jgi:phosphate starvation-inducible PhoH-like protein